MNARLLIAACALAALSGAAAEARDLTIVSRGGLYQDALRQVMVTPFSQAAGIPVDLQSWEGRIGVLRGQAETKTNTWDVVEISGDEALLGCDEGLFEKLDWSRIGGKDRYLPPGVKDCAVGAIVYSYLLSWDRDKFSGSPNWGDFWDVAKFPGKRGLQRGVRGNLEIALLADGVAPGDIYKVLRSEEGVDRAFRKLDQLKPYIVWWTSWAQSTQILSSGEVLMTSAPNGAIAAANRAMTRRFGMQWNGSLTGIDFWAVMKGSPNLDDAYRFLDFAGDPKREAALTAQVPFSGLAKGATDNLPQDIVPLIPNSHLNTSLVIDEQFWRDNLDKLTQRFNAWLAR